MGDSIHQVTRPFDLVTNSNAYVCTSAVLMAIKHYGVVTYSGGTSQMKKRISALSQYL